jgi:hypothetical protein
MKTRLLWSTLLLCLFLPWKLGAVPLTINYQGRISLTTGAQVADGPYTPTFNIYHVSTLGSPDWSETDTVNTKNGLFSVVLGLGPSPLSVLPGDQQYWLEVVWAGQTMNPRQPLTSAPYALWAGSVDLPLSGTTSSASAAIAVTNTTGPGIIGIGNNGVVGKGSSIGAKGEATAAGATGLYGDYGGFSNAYALKVSGPAQFWGGPVSFTSAVDFSGATVTGLAVNVPVPLTLSGAVAAPGVVLGVTNTGSGNSASFFATGGGSALYAQGSPNAISATVGGVGTAIYAQTGGGGFKPAMQVVTSGTSHAVEGDNIFTGSIGMLAGDQLTGQTGVFGQSSSRGVEGESMGGIGVRGLGNVGVEGLVTLTGQTAMMADYGGLANAYAMKVSGPAQFYGGPVSFTSSVDFTGATVTGLAVGVSVPLALTGTVSLPSSILSASNSGTGQAASFIANNGQAVFAQGLTGIAVAGTQLALSASSGVGGIFAQGGSYGVIAAGGISGGRFFGTQPGGNGVYANANSTNTTGVMADWGGYAGSYAMKVSGPAQFWGGPVSFTSTVDFTGATVLGLGASQSVTANVALPGGVFNASNTGTGYGVFGRSTAPGSADAQGNPLTITAGIYGYANASISAGVYGYSAYPLSNAAGVVGIGPSGVFGVATNASGQGGSFQANSGTAINAQGLNGIQARSGPGGKALELQAQSPTDTALQIDNGTSSINGSVLVASSATAGTSTLRVQQNQVNFGGNAIYGSIDASATAAVMGESFDLTAPNAQGTASSGVYGHGASGVIGQSTVPAGFGVIGTIDATGNTNSVGVFATNNGTGAGVSAQGLTGTVSRANRSGGLGLLASDGGQGGGALAFMASGGSIFNGPVTFTGAVSGINFSISAPLTLTAGLGGPIIGGSNTLSGDGVAGSAVVAAAAGVSGTNDVAGGNGVYGSSANGVGVNGASIQGFGGSFLGLTGVSASGSNAGLVATGTGNGLGILASTTGTGAAIVGNNGANASGVFGISSSGSGLSGQSTSGPAVSGQSSTGLGGNFQGANGVSATATGAGNSVGVYGGSSSGTGIGVVGSGDWGVIANGQTAGVSATCTTANGWGVWTSSQAVGGKGVVAFGDTVGVASTATNAAGTGVIANGPAMGLSATAATGNAVYGRSGVTGIVGRTDSTSSFGVQGIGTGTGTGIQGTLAAGSGGSKGVQGTNPAIGGIGVEGTNTESTVGGGIGLNGLASHSASFGVMASNPSTLAATSAGAALYVSGSVKTSRIAFTENTNYSGVWNVNGGAYVAGGPAAMVRFGAGNTGSSITQITFFNQLITTSSTVIVNFVGVAPGTCSVVAGSSVCQIYVPSTAFPVNTGFNILIIN